MISWLLAATGTVHFFLNSSSTGRGFPLYTRAIRLAHNREGMVRAAVRTLTLNVFSVPDPDIISFVSAPPACQYFSDVAHYLADQVQVRRWGAVGIWGRGCTRSGTSVGGADVRAGAHRLRMSTAQGCLIRTASYICQSGSRHTTWQTRCW